MNSPTRVLVIVIAAVTFAAASQAAGVRVRDGLGPLRVRRRKEDVLIQCEQAGCTEQRPSDVRVARPDYSASRGLVKRRRPRPTSA